MTGIKNIQNSNWKYIGLSIFFLLINIAFSQVPLTSAWAGIKITLVVMAGLTLFKHVPHLKNSKLVTTSLILALGLQIFLAFFQFKYQQSLSPYWLLGETNLNSFVGVATGTFFDGIKKLPYGTLPHPNLLAAFLLGYWVLTISFLKQKGTVVQLIKVLLTTGVFISLFLTQSIAAWLALSLFLGLSKLKNSTTLSFLLVLFFLSAPSWLILVSKNYDSLFILRRVWLNQAAATTFLHYPFLGAGIQASTAVTEQFSSQSEIVRFVQPAHHVGMLWLAETGLLGFGWLLFSCWKFRRIVPSLANLSWLIPLLAFDHYFLTLQPARILLLLLVMLYSSRSDASVHFKTSE